MTKLILACIIPVLLVSSGCATTATVQTPTAPMMALTPAGQRALDLLPKNADGSVNIQLLVTWAGEGLQAYCQSAQNPREDVCTVGMNVIAVLGTKGQDPRALLAATLDAEDRFPIVRTWIHYISQWLMAIIAYAEGAHV